MQVYSSKGVTTTLDYKGEPILFSHAVLLSNTSVAANGPFELDYLLTRAQVAMNGVVGHESQWLCKFGRNRQDKRHYDLQHTY